ncbi:MAG: heavy metal transporter, partial [Lachnospiraceae bacterium]|nr:heavy metal transporter [Lachnospiraceae bacterium]
APYYSTKLSLQAGLNSLSLYPTESFDVSTGDHRFYCYIKVVDDLDRIDEDKIREEVSSFETLIYPAEIFESLGGSCCS